MDPTPAKPQTDVPMKTEAERKQREDQAAKTLSPNPNEAVEKSIVKKSSDEVRSSPN